MDKATNVREGAGERGWHGYYDINEDEGAREGDDTDRVTIVQITQRKRKDSNNGLMYVQRTEVTRCKRYLSIAYR